MDKAGDFVVALVIYLMRCIEDGDTETLGRMGFGPEEVEELSALRLSDIQRIERLKAHLDIKVDRDAFAELIRHIRAERRSTEREHEFIRADAPLDMMRRLFGTTNREYTKLRHLYAVSSVGRPRDPSEEQEGKLWRMLTAGLSRARDGVLSPGEYLAISRECGTPLRTVWRQSKRLANGSG